MEDQKGLMEFYSYLANIKKLSERTIMQYLNYYRMLDLNLLSHQDYINAFIQTHRNNVVVRAMMFNLLQLLKLKSVEIPPAPTGRKKKRLIRPITQQEIDQLKKYLYSISFKHGLIFDILYQGALRRVEVPTIMINSFQWDEWINSNNKFCKLIVLGKNNKERKVLINSETVEMIMDHYKKIYPMNTISEITTFCNSPSLLFAKHDGSPLTDKIVYDIVKRGSKKCIGRDVRPHELRHCRADELDRMGVPIQHIKNYLGHSTLATTEIYLHRSEKESLESIENISNNN
jgi:site-specific recombinase XerD